MDIGAASGAATPMARRITAMLLLAVLGVVASAQSVLETYALRDGEAQEPAFCSIAGAFDCRAAHSSRDAFFLGVPLGWFSGLLYAWTSLVLAVGLVRPSVRRAVVRAVSVGMTAALGVTLWKAAVLAFVVRALCPLCLVLYVVNVGILGVSLERPGPSFRGAVRRCRDALGRAARRLAGHLAPGHAWAYLLALGVLLGAGAWLFTARGDLRVSTRDAALMKAVARFYRAPVVPLEVPWDSPSWGPRDAPVRIVEFSDFECPFCRIATERLRQAVRGHEDRVRLDFVHFPLDTTLNPEVKGRTHRHAGAAARAGVLAQELGVFWEFHDALFGSEFTIDRDLILEWFEGAGVDRARALEALSSTATGDAVRRHVEAGRRAGVTATPAFFVNGRPVLPFFPAVLERVLEEELRRASTPAN
jgi:protein-disulfide isomerase/uncharacterized membrane protein